MKIEGHYRTKITLLHYRLDQFNYEPTLDQFTTSACSVKSAKFPKKNKHAITLNVVTVKISKCYERADTILMLKIRLNMGQSGSSEGQKDCICHCRKNAFKNISDKNFSPR